MRDPLPPFLIRHGLAGAAAGWTTAGLLLLLDVARLRTLIAATESPLVPLVMLFAFFALTFASVAMGAAVMSLGRADRPRGESRPAAPSRLRLAALRARRPR